MTQQPDTITPDTAAPAAAPDPAPVDTPPVDGAGTPDGAAAPSGDILDTPPVDGADKTATKDVLSDDDASGDEGVPEKYTFDLSDELKEKGFEVDEGLLETFSETAKDMGLSQDQFQKLIEYDLGRKQEATDEAVGEWNDRVQGWKDQARTDKDFGGDNYDANVKGVMKAITQFGDPEFTAMLKSPSAENPEGLAIGNHPAFLRTFHRIAKAMSDTDLVLGEDVQKGDETEASLRRMYPTMYKD